MWHFSRLRWNWWKIIGISQEVDFKYNRGTRLDLNQGLYMKTLPGLSEVFTLNCVRQLHLLNTAVFATTPGCSALHTSACTRTRQTVVNSEEGLLLNLSDWNWHFQIDTECTHARTGTVRTSNVMDDAAEASQQVELVREYLFRQRRFICWMTSPIECSV